MRREIGLVVLCAWMAGAALVGAAEKVVAVSLRDGSRLVGQIVSEDDQTLTVATSAGPEVVVRRALVVSITDVGENGRSVSADPNYSRLLFGPTGRPLKKGDGYFSDYELLFPGVAFGLTDNVSLAGGVSVIPGIGLGEQLFYVSPKVGFELGDRASVAVGALVAGSGLGDSDSESAYIGFAVGTFGTPARSLTVGVGLGDTTGQFTDAVPIVMLGGTATVSRHVALVTESWLFVGDDFRLSEQPFGVGVRLFGDRLSADVGVILVGELLDEGFPLPWLSVTYHFGRDGARR
jgi:RNase P/RNase MRP subunit p29